jgi:hypothetical protein
MTDEQWIGKDVEKKTDIPKPWYYPNIGLEGWGKA